MNHKNTVQLSDQMHCKDCGQTWDMNDPYPPECPPRKLICKCKGWRECGACRTGRREGAYVYDSLAQYEKDLAAWQARRDRQ